MKYGQICPAPRRNAVLYKCFDFICEADARKFVKKFADQPHDESQVMHTFQELVVGAYMASRKLSVRYDCEVDCETPDWCILNPEVEGIIELVNFHAPKAVDESIEKQIREKGVASWWMGSNAERLYGRIQEKAAAYKRTAESRRVPYVIAVFSGINVDIEQGEIDECLSDADSGLFARYPSMSGVVFAIEQQGIYFFRYYPNPFAAKPFGFPEGVFDLNGP